MRPQEHVRILLHELRHMGPILPGSITTQYNVCGKPKCRCKDPANPAKHGPYSQLSFTVGGCSSTLFLKAADVAAAREMTAQGKRLKRLRQELGQACIELARCSGVAAVRQIAQAPSGTAALGDGAEDGGTTPDGPSRVEEGREPAGPSVKETELAKSRDHWKARALARTETVTTLNSKIRDLQRSRDQWKAKANKCGAELRRMQRRLSEALGTMPTQKKTD